MTRCEHYACRCARAAELAAMADRYNRPSLLLAAINVHYRQVECRMHPPPRGPYASMPTVLDADAAQLIFDREVTPRV